jgi:hypothetical protein
MMTKTKTFQITQTIVYEYFVEADNEDAAIEMIDNGAINPTEETEIALKIVDEHDGDDWTNEPTK